MDDDDDGGDDDDDYYYYFDDDDGGDDDDDYYYYYDDDDGNPGQTLEFVLFVFVSLVISPLFWKAQRSRSLSGSMAFATSNQWS